MNDSAGVDFFISYTQSDRVWAEWIGWQLQQAGYTVILQAWDFRPGTDWVHQMHTVVQQAKHTLAVLSPAYLESSEFGEAEWRVAFAADPGGRDRRLIPVRVRECHVEGLLGTRVYVDLVGRSEEGAVAALISGVSEQNGRPTSEPAFPGTGTAAAPARPRFPALPTVFTVPVPHNPLFTGRAEALEAIRLQLTDPLQGHVLPITGTGGVGKTQLAVEYAYAERDSYDVVWWVRASPLATAQADLAALIADPHLPDPPLLLAQASVEYRLAAARDWLERHDRCLLIVDNVEDPAEMRTLLPRGGGGHALLTARSDVGWDDWATPLPLDTLDPADASRFLRKRSRDPDEPAAVALASELGGLPLALEQAAGFIAEAGGINLADYLSMFRTRSRKLLDRGHDDDHGNTVNTTWSLSLDRLTKARPAAVDLLTLAAFLAADDIPTLLITEHASELPDRLAETATDPIELADTIRTLRRYGLAKATPDAITVHRLLQTVVRNSLDDDTQREWAGFALAVVTAGFPDDWKDSRVRPWCQRLVSHAMAAARHSRRLDAPRAAVSPLPDRVGGYLGHSGSFATARDLYETILGAREGTLGARDPATLTARANFAHFTGEAGEPSKALRLFRELLPDQVSVLGPDHPYTLTTRHGIGRWTGYAGDAAEAVRLLQELLPDRTRVLGPDDPDTLDTRRNIARWTGESGSPEAALTILRDILPRYERINGPDDRYTLNCRDSLAHWTGKTGHPDEAVRLFRSLLSDYLRVCGPSHPRTLAARQSIALFTGEAGDPAGAVRLLQELVPDRTRVLGPDHPHTLATRHSLAFFTGAAGDLAGAVRLFQELVPDYQRIYGPGHPDTLAAGRNYARWVGDAGDPARAASILEDAMPALVNARGPEHPDALQARHSLAHWKGEAGDPRSAVRLYEELIPDYERIYGPGHPDTQAARDDLARWVQMDED
jgi:hypothetical protein